MGQINRTWNNYYCFNTNLNFNHYLGIILSQLQKCLNWLHAHKFHPLTKNSLGKSTIHRNLLMSHFSWDEKCDEFIQAQHRPLSLNWKDWWAWSEFPTSHQSKSKTCSRFYWNHETQLVPGAVFWSMGTSTWSGAKLFEGSSQGVGIDLLVAVDEGDEEKQWAEGDGPRQDSFHQQHCPTAQQEEVDKQPKDKPEGNKNLKKKIIIITIQKNGIKKIWWKHKVGMLI